MPPLNAADSIAAPMPMVSSRHAHKRSSSQWVPASGPLHNPIEIFKSRASRVKGSRMIQPNHHHHDSARYDLPNYRQFTNNSITTTKYSLLTFLPYNLYQQLTTKYANVYFLFIAALNFVPAFNAYSPMLALVPPCFVLGTTMIKDGYEDYRRWRFDNDINKRNCHVWDKDRQMFRKTQWKYILVGDFVHVSNDQDIPADILLLRSSDTSGTCYVETSNLDGETSLKQRKVPRRYTHFSEEPADQKESSKFTPNDFTGTIFCEKPDKAIYTVTAKIEYETGLFEVVTKENMLLRGSKLKNTTFVEGLVMYAGHDTKVMMNNGRAPHKVSGIERMTNWFIVICVLMLVAMVGVGSLLSGLFVGRHEVEDDDHNIASYFPFKMKGPVPSAFISLGAFIICYQVLVPISLYITVEIIKLAQIYFITQDIDLYDEDTDYSINCRSLNIPEELGQISHVLSDKTGTLTENKMIFRNCSFDGNDYGGEYEPSLIDPYKPVVSLSLLQRVNDEWSSNDSMRHFFLDILLNNSVVVNKIPHHDAIEIGTFQAGEYSIGNATFYDVTQEEFDEMVNDLKIIHSPEPLDVEVLETRPSSSTLSDIPEEDEVQSTVYGLPVPSFARSTVSSPSDATPPQVLSRVSSISRSVAMSIKRNIISPISSILPSPSEPFRMRGSTVREEEEFCPYEAESPDELALIQGAALYGFKLEDRSVTHVTIRRPDGTKEDIAVSLVLPFDSHRKRMSVVVETEEGPLLYTKGADSAIMDRLSTLGGHHDALSQLIHDYSCRGLRTLCFAMRILSQSEFKDFKSAYEFIMMDTSTDREMMLSSKADEIEKNLHLLGVTGIEDRLQDGVENTVVSLRKAGMQVWVLTGDKLETAENIARASGLFDPSTEVKTVTGLNSLDGLGQGKYNLILSPEAVMMVRNANIDMLNALKGAECVLCYRMTPSEKADIVKSVKDNIKGKVLAIGDGANDVPMIQAAHVGIGVKGKEGMQAVMACDFAIGRFRFLQKLLLVHGHWCYDRLALSFLYFLYKNTNSVFVLFFYQFFDGYSGAFSIDPTYAVLYPIIFTSVQPIMVGVMDQDYSVEELLARPQLYKTGIDGCLYTYTLFFVNLIDGIWQAAVIYFVSHITLWGTDVSLWTFGFYMATGMMLANCVHLAIEVRSWTKMLTACFVFFIAVHFGYFSLYSIAAQPGWVPDPPTLMAQKAMADSRFWLAMLITTVVALLPRFMFRVVANSNLA